MSKVKLRNITKTFDDVKANDNISLDIEEEDFLVLLGPSGCGKSTLLRIIAGLEIPDEGEIYIGEKKVNDLPPKDRNIGLVFQGLALYSHMDAFENIAFPLKIEDKSEEEIEKRVKEVADIVDATNLLDRNISQLSGGEKQRIALARTLVRDPDIFLMDEPLANMDAKLKIYMRGELQRLHREIDATIVYVTHDQKEAMTMADKIVVMNEGAVHQVGTPAELYNEPANLFVARFIGSPTMGLLEGKLQKRDGEWNFSNGGISFPISDRLGEYLSENASSEDVVVGFRPEDLNCVEEQEEEELVISGKIDVIEPVGSDVFVEVIIGDKSMTARLDYSKELEVGKEISLKVDETKMFFFDKQSEEIISGRGELTK